MAKNTHLLRVLARQKREDETEAKSEDNSSEFSRLVKDIIP